MHSSALDANENNSKAPLIAGINYDKSIETRKNIE